MTYENVEQTNLVTFLMCRFFKLFPSSKTPLVYRNVLKARFVYVKYIQNLLAYLQKQSNEYNRLPTKNFIYLELSLHFRCNEKGMEYLISLTSPLKLFLL